MYIADRSKQDSMKRKLTRFSRLICGVGGACASLLWLVNEVWVACKHCNGKEDDAPKAVLLFLLRPTDTVKLWEHTLSHSSQTFVHDFSVLTVVRCRSSFSMNFLQEKPSSARKGIPKQWLMVSRGIHRLKTEELVAVPRLDRHRRDPPRVRLSKRLVEMPGMQLIHSMLERCKM